MKTSFKQFQMQPRYVALCRIKECDQLPKRQETLRHGGKKAGP
jgi:hypothetical protein